MTLALWWPSVENVVLRHAVKYVTEICENGFQSCIKPVERRCTDRVQDVFSQVRGSTHCRRYPGCIQYLLSSISEFYTRLISHVL